MNETSTIGLLIAAISGLVVAIGSLVTALVYMYKQNERTQRESYKQFTECINRSNIVIQKNIEMLERVERQANWRAR